MQPTTYGKLMKAKDATIEVRITNKKNGKNNIYHPLTFGG